MLLSCGNLAWLRVHGLSAEHGAELAAAWEALQQQRGRRGFRVEAGQEGTLLLALNEE